MARWPSGGKSWRSRKAPLGQLPTDLTCWFHQCAPTKPAKCPNCNVSTSRAPPAMPRHSAQLAHSLLSADWLGMLVGGASSSTLLVHKYVFSQRMNDSLGFRDTPLVVPASSYRRLVRTRGCQGAGPAPEVVGAGATPLAGGSSVRRPLLLRWGLSCSPYFLLLLQRLPLLSRDTSASGKMKSSMANLPP